MYCYYSHHHHYHHYHYSFRFDNSQTNHMLHLVIKFNNLSPILCPFTVIQCLPFKYKNC